MVEVLLKKEKNQMVEVLIMHHTVRPMNVYRSHIASGYLFSDI
jgi:hypothetical protein